MKKRIFTGISGGMLTALAILAPVQASAVTYPSGPAGTTVSFFLSDPTNPTQPMASGSGMFWTSDNKNWQFASASPAGMVYFPWSPGDYQISTLNRATDTADQADRINYHVLIDQSGKITVTDAGGSEIAPAAPAVYVVSSNLPEVIDPNSPWKKLSNVPLHTAGHMLLLTDGSVLFHDEGANQTGTSDWWKLTPDKFGSYLSGTWAKLASTPNNYQPANLASGLLPNGNVILEGGDMNGSSTWVGINQGAEYDPVANTWTMIDPPNNGSGDFSSIADAPSVVLPNGRFMFGPSGNGANGAINQKDVALFDAQSSAWTVVTGSNRQSANPETGFTLLPNGKVLSISTKYQSNDSQADIYDPTTNTWSATQPLPNSLLNPATADGTPIAEIGPALTMPNGKVFAEGSNANSAIYDPASNSWSAGPHLPVIGGVQFSAADAPSAILPNGNVLVAMSPVNAKGESIAPTNFFTFDGSSFTKIDSPAGANLSKMPAFVTGLIPLPNGEVMMTVRGASAEIFLYTPTGAAKTEWLPKITQAPSVVIPGNTYQISGEQLSGLTTGASYGDDWNPNTNYPLVQLSNSTSGDVRYARTFDISSYSIAANAPGSLSFQVPTDLPLGTWKLRVTASGFASDPVTVKVGSTAQDVNPSPSVAAGSGATPSPAKTSPSPTSTVKLANPQVKKTLICMKGSSTKRIAGSAPKCPAGYSAKKAGK